MLFGQLNKWFEQSTISQLSKRSYSFDLDNQSNSKKNEFSYLISIFSISKTTMYGIRIRKYCFVILKFK